MKRSISRHLASVRPPLPAVAALVLALALVATACSGDSSSGSTDAADGSPTSTEAPQAASTSEPAATTGTAAEPAPGQDNTETAVNVVFLSEEANALLRECAAGSDASCDAAQVPGVLNDGAFSLFNVECDENGQEVYCALREGLVAAELRGVDLAVDNGVLSDQVLLLRGIGPVSTGMTLAQAEAALGSPLVSTAGAPNESCFYVVSEVDSNSPRLMVVTGVDGFGENVIARIELLEGQQTASGIRIGSTKAEVLAAYGDQIEATPHKYTSDEGGEYLTFVPNDPPDANYRLVMEVLDDQVTQIRSGLLPAVEWVEGCL